MAVGYEQIGLFIYWTGVAAVAVNAVTGVLEAGRKQADLVGATFAALAAALGGGTVRDLLLDRTVFWVADQNYILVALGATLGAFFAGRVRRVPPRLFLVPDAIGLALFTIVGTQIGVVAGAPWLVASLLGVITGVVGGVLRDVLCNEVPLVFGGELYATAALAGALLYLGLQAVGVAELPAAGAGMVAVLALRLAAIRWDIRLPTLRAD